ncbi:hypothetical protein SAMN06265182_1821 [Persephonella hydrogeniphila]|uniref:Cytochrome C and Quinol oxidase polypeptide I n=1 Tax=Persephonella hydrogeniphila TaxID=198703 RepID=A0A285NLF1_9AQUI|nr:hypothetical protein [Persephonella hydrogeniphila]SNZ10322.1 hypothetical protein SAMN06265182_1821 [Persephonella hydrogeniphila]
MRVVGSLATKLAPPFSLVLHYFIAGVVFNFLSIIALFLFWKGFSSLFYSFEYAALAHLFLLGFVMMIIFGALYQLIPVALEIPVFSFKIGYLQFYLYISGLLIFVFSFYFSNLFRILPLGASLVYLSVLLFIVNFYMSLRKLEKFSITAKFLTVAVTSLLIGITLGLFLAFNFVYSFYGGDIIRFIIAHVLFTLFGFVLMVVMGVSMVLLPMFSLAHKFNDIFINIAFYVMVISVFGGGILILFFNSPAVFYSVFVLAFAGMFLYIIQVFEIYRKRPRKTKDTGMNTMFFSHIFLGFSIISGLLTPFTDKGFLLFGLIITFGFLNFIIYGSLYKIVPFLTWFHRFSSLVGKKRVPMLADMLPPKLPDIQITISVIGFVLLFISVIFGMKYLYILSVVTMLTGAALFLYLFFYVLNFKGEE